MGTIAVLVLVLIMLRIGRPKPYIKTYKLKPRHMDNIKVKIRGWIKDDEDNTEQPLDVLENLRDRARRILPLALERIMELEDQINEGGGQ